MSNNEKTMLLAMAVLEKINASCQGNTNIAVGLNVIASNLNERLAQQSYSAVKNPIHNLGLFSHKAKTAANTTNQPTTSPTLSA